MITVVGASKMLATDFIQMLQVVAGTMVPIVIGDFDFVSFLGVAAVHTPRHSIEAVKTLKILLKFIICKY